MEQSRKGIILAGGSGTRLYPLARGVLKQLMPVFDKPMIYYPLSTLMLAGIRDILIITTPEDAELFATRSATVPSLAFRSATPSNPGRKGPAQAFHIGADFVANSPSALILEDNIFCGHGLPELLANADARCEGASVFAYRVTNHESFGMVEFDRHGKAVSIEEKPRSPASNYAVTGHYFYDQTAVERAREFRPSARGELAITDLARSYLEEGSLSVEIMGRGFAWLDTGTHSSLLDAATYVRILEERQGLKIACLEEIGWRKGFVDDEELARIAELLLGRTHSPQSCGGWSAPSKKGDFTTAMPGWQAGTILRSRSARRRSLSGFSTAPRRSAPSRARSIRRKPSDPASRCSIAARPTRR